MADRGKHSCLKFTDISGSILCSVDGEFDIIA